MRQSSCQSNDHNTEKLPDIEGVLQTSTKLIKASITKSSTGLQYSRCLA